MTLGRSGTYSQFEFDFRAAITGNDVGGGFLGCQYGRINDFLCHHAKSRGAGMTFELRRVIKLARGDADQAASPSLASRLSYTQAIIDKEIFILLEIILNYTLSNQGVVEGIREKGRGIYCITY
jgi:hypothetical protein